MTRRVLCVVLALLIFVTTASAGLNIPREMWQPNQSPGYCGWVSLKTLMLYQGWDEIAKRVVEDETKLGSAITGYRYDPFGNMVPIVNPAGGCSTDKVSQRLSMYHDEYGLEYQQLMPVSKNFGEVPDEGRVNLLRDYIRKGWGAVVSTKKGAHAVVLVDISDKTHTYTYHESFGDVSRQEHEVSWIDCNDVEGYQKKLREYEEGTRKEKPKPPKLARTSLEWWVRSDWDGWAIVIKPNEPVLAQRRLAAAKTTVVRHEEKKPEEKRTLEKRDEPVKPLPTPPKDEPKPAPQESAPKPPAIKLEEHATKKPKPKSEQVAKVPLTEIAPIAPLPPAAQIQEEMPTFPKAQPQPLLLPAFVMPKQGN